MDIFFPFLFILSANERVNFCKRFLSPCGNFNSYLSYLRINSRKIQSVSFYRHAARSNQQAFE